MEVVQEVAMGSNDHVHIVKGKRTKRQRPSSPIAAADMTTSYSWSGEDGVDEDVQGYLSPTTSAEFGESTEEEEDMANCLILLAQGHGLNNSKQIEDTSLLVKFSSPRYNEGATTTTTNKAGYYVYQCKTCNRCFPSFQALGGHRASHKKPKAIVGEKKTLMLLEDVSQFNMMSSPSLNLQIGNRAPYTSNKSKVHECSICGAEFSSGQALGGHMRRHRLSTTANVTNTSSTIMTESQQQHTKKPRMSLDLNLPAPEEDRDPKYLFAPKQSLVFSASSLVDCHY